MESDQLLKNQVPSHFLACNLKENRPNGLDPHNVRFLVPQADLRSLAWPSAQRSAPRLAQRDLRKLRQHLVSAVVAPGDEDPPGEKVADFWGRWDLGLWVGGMLMGWLTLYL